MPQDAPGDCRCAIRHSLEQRPEIVYALLDVGGLFENPDARRPGWRAVSGRDHHQHAAGGVLDEGFGDGAAPPAGGPAVEVLVADNDQVGLEAARALDDFINRVAGDDFAVDAEPGPASLRTPASRISW